MNKWITVAIVAVVTIIICLVLNWWFNGAVNKHKPSQQGKAILITGANAGLGFIAAEELVKLNPQVVICACRDKGRGLAAVEKIKASTKKDCIEFMQLDLNDLESVKKFAITFSAKYDRLDTLMMNAGRLGVKERQETKQGHEAVLGVNHIGHFLLYKLLIDKVKASQEGRIVVVASVVHRSG